MIDLNITTESIVNRIPCLERRYHAHRNRRTGTSANSSRDIQPAMSIQSLDGDCYLLNY